VIAVTIGPLYQATWTYIKSVIGTAISTVSPLLRTTLVLSLTYAAVQFLARDSIYAIARYMLSPVRLSVRLSVCPSVRHTGGSVKDG